MQEANELIMKRLVEKVNMPEEVAMETSELLADALGPNQWQDTLFRRNNSGEWGQFATRPGDENTVTSEGQAMAEALTGLQSSEVFMDEVIAMTDGLQKNSGKNDWESWKKISTNAAARARMTIVEGLNEEIQNPSFLTAEKAGAQPLTAEGNLRILGSVLGDAHTADVRNYANFFDNPTHPGILELAKRRSGIGEMNAIFPKTVVGDLNLKPGFGKPVK